MNRAVKQGSGICVTLVSVGLGACLGQACKAVVHSCQMTGRKGGPARVVLGQLPATLTKIHKACMLHGKKVVVSDSASPGTNCSSFSVCWLGVAVSACLLPETSVGTRI
jgi:hypothetical protein